MEQEKNKMGLLEHLSVLRIHLLKASIYFIIFSAISCFFSNFLFSRVIFSLFKKDFITNQILEYFGFNSFTFNISNKLEIINTKLAGQFMTDISVIVTFGILLSFPFILYQIWTFIKPALYKKEKKYSRIIILSSCALFFVGLLFGYYVICPLSFRFLINYSVSSDVVNRIEIRSIISSFCAINLSSAIMFQLPIIIYGLTRLEIVSPNILKKYRKHAFIILLLLSAFLTPPDIFSQIIVCLPLGILYETGIFISQKAYKKKKLYVQNYYN
ncbi:MAG: twin-arginine translocase subunit TatC [Marinifilaceae bacterium]|jgi:sec-independent protein translocase protein TatC|nr:twin-arginine translocase subunit TatC [Marinifilaceae bacterium]